jgi:hypothetical protein
MSSWKHQQSAPVLLIITLIQPIEKYYVREFLNAQKAGTKLWKESNLGLLLVSILYNSYEAKISLHTHNPHPQF